MVAPVSDRGERRAVACGAGSRAANTSFSLVACQYPWVPSSRTGLALSYIDSEVMWSQIGTWRSEMQGSASTSRNVGLDLGNVRPS